MEVKGKTIIKEDGKPMAMEKVQGYLSSPFQDTSCL